MFSSSFCCCVKSWRTSGSTHTLSSFHALRAHSPFSFYYFFSPSHRWFKSVVKTKSNSHIVNVNQHTHSSRLFSFNPRQSYFQFQAHSTPFFLHRIKLSFLFDHFMNFISFHPFPIPQTTRREFVYVQYA